MGKSAEDKKHMVLIGILVASLIVLGRPYITGHSSPARPVRNTTRPLPGLENRRPTSPAIFDSARPADAPSTRDDDSSLSEIERLLR